MSAILTKFESALAHRSSKDGLTDAEVSLALGVAPSPLSSHVPGVITTARDVVHTVTKSVFDGTALRNITALVQLSGQLFAPGAPLDDRKYLLERVVQLLADTNGSIASTLVGNQLVATLFTDLQHPPVTIMGHKNEFRSVDGSGNNPYQPTLGAARTPYARNAQRKAPLVTPDAGIVFDTLLARKGFKPHPQGIASLLFSMANLIIHDAFRTSPKDAQVNLNSSYLDMQWLYGNDEQSQNSIRTFSQGMIFPDTIADMRLALMTPSSTALAMMFARNHNFIAKKLWQLDEGDRLKNMAGDKERDCDNFHRARLVNCGFYVNVILRDYIPAILALQGNEWYLNPLEDIRGLDGARVPRATGNQVASEFNILYRWHCTTSMEDEKWLNDTFIKMFPNKHADEVTVADFRDGAHNLAKKLGSDPPKWELHGWERDSQGKFDDSVLAKTLQDATEEVAGAFRARGVPEWMRVIDILGMNQAREQGLCTLNEFRASLGLTRLANFAEWNSDPEVQKAAEKLYGHIDQLELFPGLLAEEPKPAQPASGLCPGHTISRAILSDAASLIRGDRFYTSDFTSSALTTWGYQYATQPQAGSQGVVAKMLFNCLPTEYATSNSTFALYPFMTPPAMLKVLEGYGKADEYTIQRPSRSSNWHGTTTWHGAHSVFMNTKSGHCPYAPRIANCSQSNDAVFVMGVNDRKEHAPQREALDQLFFGNDFKRKTAAFLEKKTKELLVEKSIQAGNKTSLVDIVADVTILSFTAWAADHWAIPLREQLPGAPTLQELYIALATQFAHVFCNFDFMAGVQAQLRAGAQKSGALIEKIVGARMWTINTPVVKNVLPFVQHFTSLFGRRGENLVEPSKSSVEFYRAAWASSGDQTSDHFKSVVTKVHGLMISSIATQTQQAALILEVFLRPEHDKHLKRLHELANGQWTASDEKEFVGYLWEGMRLNPQAPVCPRTAVDDFSIRDGEDEIRVKKGDSIFVGQKAANYDASVFPNPKEIDPFRPNRESYMLFGVGMHRCLGEDLLDASLAAVLKPIFALPNLRTAPGPTGRFSKSSMTLPGGTEVYTYQLFGADWPFPTSLQVLYGAPAPAPALKLPERTASQASLISDSTHGHKRNFASEATSIGSSFSGHASLSSLGDLATPASEKQKGSPDAVNTDLPSQ
ncbi:heme peroxidase [Ceraceosorus guamensis]|uniref:linoleate 8R-lipoxygenase n=1 Tax=Ceraceosorus guamensis TaxID=1522189 RepID=A0A316W387_9BASI|nr:heme peroxidase [Ceraceosorus guamensis]PWN44159.1 heme peroxidase [Ceraceosorus guamensis]